MSAAVTLTPPVKVCSSGHVWTREAWDALPALGVQEVPAGDDGPAYALELKQCPKCKTCMAIPCDPPPPAYPPDTEWEQVALAQTDETPAEGNHNHELCVERDRGTP